MKTLCVLSLFLALACGDDQSKLVGVYVLDTWTENPDSCASEGASILADQGQTHLVVKQFDFFGLDILSASSCESLAECEEQLSSDALDLGGFNFEKGSDSKGWTGATVIAGGDPNGGDCSGQVRDFLMTATEAEAVEIQTEVRSVSGFPRDSDGFCDTDSAQEAAEDVPCEALEVLTASPVEDEA